MMEQPIRILQVVTYMGRGGLETMLMNYYRHMDRDKVQFDFLTHRAFRGDYDDEIEALGGRIYRLPRLNPWSGSYRRALDAFFAEHAQYRIVHVHQDCMSAVILKAAKKWGVPVRIAHSHNSDQEKNFKYPIKLFYKRRIPQYATALFACGRDAGDWMFGGAPYRIVPNAIDTAQYVYCSRRAAEMRARLGIPPDAFVVGHVGRFQHVKNHSFLLDIFGEVVKTQENARLLLVGDGDLRQKTEEKAAALGLAEKVMFTGVRNDVPDLLQAMDCFVFPSLFEGIPVALMEAQASGLPCVVSDGVPADCRISRHFERLALAQSPEIWALRILASPAGLRRDGGREIGNAGYDIASNARWLQDYYLDQWKKEV